jgi:hypothetical protein
MPSSFWLLARKPRLIEWLMLLALAVFFISSQIVMNEEGRPDLCRPFAPCFERIALGAP